MKFMSKYYTCLKDLLSKFLKRTDYLNINLKPLNSSDSLDIITIAFNNTFVLKHQIQKIKKNIKDKNYTHIIVDNSNKWDKRIEIRNMCEDEGLSYIGLPDLSKKSFCPSTSHAQALNWTYQHVIKKRKPTWFGFIDHDIFPIQSQSIFDMIGNQPFFGRKETRKQYWYLWPGFCFFRFDFLREFSVDFSPTRIVDTNLDTGGALWCPVYSKLNMSDFIFCNNLRIPLNQLGYPYEDEVEFLNNNWFHSLNASLWRDASDYRDAIEDILKKEISDKEIQGVHKIDFEDIRMRFQ